MSEENEDSEELVVSFDNDDGDSGCNSIVGPINSKSSISNFLLILIPAVFGVFRRKKLIKNN